MIVAPPAPHAPFTPARRHENVFNGTKATRTPAFNFSSTNVSNEQSIIFIVDLLGRQNYNVNTLQQQLSQQTLHHWEFFLAHLFSPEEIKKPS